MVRQCTLMQTWGESPFVCLRTSQVDTALAAPTAMGHRLQSWTWSESGPSLHGSNCRTLNSWNAPAPFSVFDPITLYLPTILSSPHSITYPHSFIFPSDMDTFLYLHSTSCDHVHFFHQYLAGNKGVATQRGWGTWTGGSRDIEGATAHLHMFGQHKDRSST